MPDGQASFDNRTQSAPATKQRPVLKVTTAKTIEDIMRVTAIRAAVYMAEQDCPYEEEFDGNDFCATHLIGWVNGEPVACVRVRYFGDFVKAERFAVRQTHRKSRIAFKMIRATMDHCARKGFTKMICHARNELISLYRMFGFRVDEDARSLVFSDYAYTEMVRDLDPPTNAISIDTDPYALIRPEGEWDNQGVLEASLDRPALGADASTGSTQFSFAAE